MSASEGIERSDWIPVNEAEVTDIPDGSRATFTFEPDASGMFIETVAASKFSGVTYQVKVDGVTRYSETGIPPTDIDDLQTTHNPRMEVQDQLEVIVRNTSGNQRTVAAQIRGVEQ